MKKSKILMIGTSIAGVAALITASRVLTKITNTKKYVHRNNFSTVPKDEDKAITYLVETSATASTFAERYTNWLLQINGMESMADGIYLKALRYWGIYTSEDLLFKSELYMALNNHRLEVINAYGSIDTILNLVIDKLYSAGINCKDSYHCYNNVESAVTWERIIPTLKEMISSAIEKQDIVLYELALQPYLITLASCANDRYVQEVSEILRIINTEDVDTMSESEIKLYDLISSNVTKIKRILQAVEKSCAV